MGDSETNSSDKPLRILMTADTVGGVWRYSIDLIQALACRGAHVLLATLGPRPSGEQKREALEIPGIVLAESSFALEWMENPWADVDASGKWLLSLADDFSADVIHLNGYAHATLEWQKPALVVAHSCVFSWWRAVHGAAPGPEWNEYRRRVSAGITAADAIVAPSEFMAAALQREYGLNSTKVCVIHNFSRLSRLRPRAKEPFILVSGRIWDQAKNVALLNSIAPQVDWEIRVTGPESSALPDKKAQFLGLLTRTEMLDQMHRAAIFAHPALYEPFGLSILEAANARCCLVLSDIPSLRELWEDAAVFVNPREPERWLSELNSLSHDPLKRRKLSNLAFSSASRYSPDRSVDKYWNLYRSLADLPRKTRTEAAA